MALDRTGGREWNGMKKKQQKDAASHSTPRTVRLE